jgi:hypothetical protein
MLGALIKANVEGRPAKRRDFDHLETRVGIRVRDIGESVTLDFGGGRLLVHNGLKPKRAITITADSETVMELSLLRIGLFGLPVYYDSTGRDVVRKLLAGTLKIDGMAANIFSLNAVTRIFSVQ